MNLADHANNSIIVSMGLLARDLEKSPNFMLTRIVCIATIVSKSLISSATGLNLTR